MFVSTEEHHENPVRPREKSFAPLHHLGRIIVIHLIRGFQGKKPAAQLDIHYILMNDRALLNPPTFTSDIRSDRQDSVEQR